MPELAPGVLINFTLCLCVESGHNSKGGGYLKGWWVSLSSNFPLNADCSSKLECFCDKKHKSLCVCFKCRISLRSCHTGISLFQII